MVVFSPNRRLNKTLTSDNLWLYFLAILKVGRVHAYVIRDQVAARFGFTPGLITGYLVLYRLEGEGLITSKQEGKRKYYYLTAKGRRALAAGKRTLRALASKL